VEVEERYSYLARIRGLGKKKKKGGSWGLLGVGPRSKQAMVCPFAKAREQNIVKKQGCLGSKIQGVVFLWVNVQGSEVVDRRM